MGSLFQGQLYHDGFATSGLAITLYVESIGAVHCSDLFTFARFDLRQAQCRPLACWSLRNSRLG